MALTADLSTTTLTGTYVDIAGNPIIGSVRFSPQSIIKDKDQNQIIINAPITTTLNANGSFSVVLPVTDDQDVAPIPFAYQVEEIFAGGRTFFIGLPGGVATQDIADISPAVTTTEAANFVTASQFNILDARYIAAQSKYDDITNIAATLELAKTHATNASNSAIGASKAPSQLLLMGL
jgi:hypothetical protein